MMLFAAFLLIFSLLLVWRGVVGRATQQRRVLRLIFASCLFFSSFFLLVQQLAEARYITIVHEPWLASITSPIASITLAGGEKASVSIVVENHGSETFDSTDEKMPVFLSFHILDADGGMLVFENPRFAFAEPLRSRQQQTLVAVLDKNRLALPDGRYIVEFDLVREGAFWFQTNSRAARTLRMPLRLQGGNAP